MTAKANPVPVSIDYTSRDYYSIREELIKRVQDRTGNAWKGTDPNDFGLALVESFAYMGDMVNYYIDRIANESYILTATQRETLLNLAKTYGYTPASYSSALASLTITNRNGYSGAIGATTIESGTFTATAATVTSGVVTYICRNTFAVGDIVTITGFNNASFNLTSAVVVSSTAELFTVSAAITGTTTGIGVVTPSLNNYAKIIVPTDHPFDIVTTATKYSNVNIQGVQTFAAGMSGGQVVQYNTSVYNGTFPVLKIGYGNIGRNVVWYKPSATITNAVYDSGTSTITVTASGNLVPQIGQKFLISGVKKSGDTGSAATSTINGTWLVSGTTSTGFTVAPLRMTNTTSYVTTDGGDIIYSIKAPYNYDGNTPSVWNDVVVGQHVAVSGLTPSGFNTTDSVVTAVVNTTASVSKVISDTVSGTVTYHVNKPFVAKQVISTSNIVSVSNPSGSLGSGFNLNDVEVASVDASSNVQITGVIPDSSGSGIVTFEVAGGFGGNPDFFLHQYVDISGITNVADANVPETKVYNMTGVRIEAINTTSFTVFAFWSQVATVDGTSKASINKVVVNVLVNDTPYTGGGPIGGMICRQFRITKSATLTSKAVSGTSGSGTVMTYTTSTAHGFTAGNLVTVTGASISAFNVVSATLLTASGSTFTVSGSGTGSATGATAVSHPSNTTPNLVPVVNNDYLSGGLVEPAPLPPVIEGGNVYVVGSTTVPKGTQVTGAVTVNGTTENMVFTTLTDTAVGFNANADVIAMHGEDISVRAENAKDPLNPSYGSYDIAGELLAIGTGLAGQSYPLKESVVHTSYTPGFVDAYGDIRVYVDKGTIFEEWQRVEYLMDYGPNDTVFTVDVDQNDHVNIAFGDGVSGAIPPNGKTIKTTYIAGGGTVGNVGEGVLSTWGVIPAGSDVVSSIKNHMTVVNNDPATGGTDPETNDSIRYNAPRAMRSLSRAVTLRDFADLALTVSGVAKAKAIAERGASVTVYISPTSTDSQDPTPGILGNVTLTGQLTTLKETVRQFLTDRCQIGTTVTVTEPTYVPSYLTIKYSVLPQYSVDTVYVNILNVIVDKFSYNNSSLGDVITPEEVEFQLRQVDGVSNIRVTEMYRSNGSGRNSLVGSPNEIFYFPEANITLNQASNVSTLGALTVAAFNVGGSALAAPTWSPTTFTAGSYTYHLTLPATSNNIKLTPTATAGGLASIAVNGATVASGVASDAILVSAGVDATNTVVTVTAEDGVSVTTYVIWTSV